MLTRGLGDINDEILNDPAFQSVWAGVQNQLLAEGASSLTIKSAHGDMLDSFRGLSRGLHVDTGQALNAARDLVVAGRTVYGAISMVEGLVSSIASGAPPAAVVGQFTGVLVGIGVAAGSITAGVGAGIMAGVGITLKVLQDAGLFGGPPTGAEACRYGNTVITYVPQSNADQRECADNNRNCQWLVGCLVMYGTRCPSPYNTVCWRKFPVQGDLWYGASWFERPAPNERSPIELAFPEWNRLWCAVRPAGDRRVFGGGTVHDSGGWAANWGFYQAFFTAWKANKEYALNGLAPRPDWEVLLQVLNTWNTAHEPGDVIVYEGRPYDIDVDRDRDCSSAVPYISILVNDLASFGNVRNPDNQGSDNKIRIHNGPRKKAIVTAGIGAAGAGGGSSAGSVAKGAAWVVGLGLLGVAGYSFVAKKSFTGVLQSGWRKTGSGFKKALHLRGRR